MRLHLRRLAVIGVGLIGGSCAMALKAAGACASVVGVGRDAGNLRAARDLGVIDDVETDPAAAVHGADLVLVATPVAQMPRVLAIIGGALDADAVVTDAGSTKQDVVAAARAALGTRIGQFVPGHPIAGAEQSGVRAAREGLFRDRRVVLTPLPENAAGHVDRVRAMWECCGARVTTMAPAAHDTVFAAVSHLPHLLAFALVQEVAQRADAETLFGFAAGGFRDFTRIASSHPEMWRDICVANREALLDETRRFEARLVQLRGLIEDRDGVGLERAFAEARAARNAWIDRVGGPAAGS